MNFQKYLWTAALWLPAQAQPLPDLVQEALRGNREILAAQKKYEAARQRPAQESSLPDPMASLGYSSNGGPYPGAGLGRDATSNIGVMVSQEIPFPGKRKLRGEIAAKEAGAEFEQYLAVRLNVISRLKQAYHELHHANAGVLFVTRYQDLLRNILRISEARYSVGRAAQQDIFKAQTQFSIFQTQLLRYQQEQSTQQIEINALLNRPQGGLIEVPEEMEAGEIPVTLEEMLANARTKAPALAREQKMVQRNELAANLARKGFYPDYTVSGGYFNQGAMPPMWQFRVDFKIPAWLSKQRAAVTEQTFAVSEARHNYEAADVAIQAQIRNQYTLAETARKLVELYQKAVIPQAQLALESSMASYETGSLDFLSLFTNFMSVVDYQLMYHEEIMQFHVALAKLEELTGMEIE
ncbi:MAG TPA: TolC family protein [Candidatus Acidoferrales bacterium]|nr:TolC family protein [Candidatus Acidoferrales bacterium]